MRIKRLELRIKQQKRILALFFILYSLFFISPVFAQDDGIGQSQITPASPLYFLKSVREILELKFAGTTNIKFLRHLEFATRRIREVKSLAKTTRQDLIAPALERYWSELGEVKKLVNLKDEKMAAEVSGVVSRQMDALLETYSHVSDQSARRSIRVAVSHVSEWEQQLITTLDSFNKYPHAQQVTASKLLACNFLAKEASSSALNEVERVVFEARAKKCSENLR